MKLFFKISMCVVLTLTAILFSLGTYAVHVTANVSFDESKLIKTCENTTYLDCFGKKIEYTDKNEVITIKIDNLPFHVKQSFIAIEDKRFYKHKGIDYQRIIGASLKNLKSKGFKEGASTISQQLIKNTHLSNEKTIKRKLKEIKLTKALEKRYSKDQILEMYLNTIYFGEGSYGIEKAAHTYFGKTAAKLELHESAMLAGLIKAPSAYSPYRHEDKCVQRRNLVLNCMLEQGFITKTECNKAKSEQLKLNYEKDKNDYSAYVTAAKHETEEILADTPWSIYDNYNVYTYCNTEHMRNTVAEIEDQSLPYDFCAILCDNKSQGITAFVSSVGMVKRCPASTVKPWLVYAEAIEENEITQATKILDEKTNFNGFYPCNNNEKYYGYVSAKEALIKSLNIPAVKLANCLGMKKMKEYAKKMNVELNGGLGVSLGAIDSGMTIKEICECYSVFSHNGDFAENKFIKRITTKDGKIIYEHSPTSKKIFSDNTAYIINDMLNECTKNGTAKKLNGNNFELCGKTGTNGTNKGNIDAYCISYNPEFTIGFWLGNADNSPMPNSVSGGTFPTIISKEIWNSLNKTEKFTNFKQPADVIRIKLDKTSYENDHCLYQGEDGPEFLFKKDTVPSRLNKKANCVENINHICTDGIYSLTFELIGYNGADILYKYGKSEYSVNADNGSFECSLLPNIEYTFTILPFTIVNGTKIYEDQIILPNIKYVPVDKKINPPSNDWWTDD